MRRWVLVLALMGACTDKAEPPDPDRSAIEAYQAELAQLRRESMMYVATMDVATLDTCVGTHNTYDLEVRSLIVQRMAALATELDALITAHAGASFADVACITEGMHVALDDHDAAACTFDTTDANAAEAHRYLDGLTVLLDAGVARTNEMLAGFDAGSDAWAFAAPVTACP